MRPRKNQREFYYQELACATAAVGDDTRIRHHLGRAHIISQSFPSLHLYTHFLMLVHALKSRDPRETIGQLLRIAVTLPGHVFGKVPQGNIGWSTVGLTEQMPIPPDLQQRLQQ